MLRPREQRLTHRFRSEFGAYCFQHLDAWRIQVSITLGGAAEPLPQELSRLRVAPVRHRPWTVTYRQ